MAKAPSQPTRQRDRREVSRAPGGFTVTLLSWRFHPDASSSGRFHPGGFMLAVSPCARAEFVGDALEPNGGARGEVVAAAADGDHRAGDLPTISRRRRNKTDDVGFHKEPIAHAGAARVRVEATRVGESFGAPEGHDDGATAIQRQRNGNETMAAQLQCNGKVTAMRR